MTNIELKIKSGKLKGVTAEALTAFFAGLDNSQRKELLKNGRVKILIKRHGVSSEEAD